MPTFRRMGLCRSPSRKTSPSKAPSRLTAELQAMRKGSIDPSVIGSCQSSKFAQRSALQPGKALHPTNITSPPLQQAWLVAYNCTGTPEEMSSLTCARPSRETCIQVRNLEPWRHASARRWRRSHSIKEQVCSGGADIRSAKQPQQPMSECFTRIPKDFCQYSRWRSLWRAGA
jgi:hypothetical protein